MQDPPPNPPHMLFAGRLAIDTLVWRVLLEGAPIEDLTPLEFKVLVYLAQNAGRVVTPDELLLWVWKCTATGSGNVNSVKCCIRRLRAKLGKWGRAHLRAIRGVGYRLDGEDG